MKVAWEFVEGRDGVWSVRSKGLYAGPQCDTRVRTCVVSNALDVSIIYTNFKEL